MSLKSQIHKSSSNKAFGILFSIIFLLIGLYPLLYSKSYNIWAILISIILFLLAFIAPKSLTMPNKLWTKFGLLLGSISTPIIIFLIYFLIVVPTGLIFKILRKDLINMNLNRNLKSYWIKREEPLGSMKKQF